MPRTLGRATERGEAGSVTAETAVALPALALVAAACAVVIAAVGLQVRCIDAARLAARAVARGEDLSAARAAAMRAAPHRAQVSIGRRGELVVVTVRAPVGGDGLVAGLVGGFSVEASAAAPDETSVSP